MLKAAALFKETFFFFFYNDPTSLLFHRGDPGLVKLNVAITCGYLLYGELLFFSSLSPVDHCFWFSQSVCGVNRKSKRKQLDYRNNLSFTATSGNLDFDMLIYRCVDKYTDRCI